jgi:hypothetical protein
MLKLEKQKYRDISVTMRDKKSCINRSFLYALAIAIGMHLFAVLIFHIHSILVSDVILPPTLVEIDTNGIFDENDPAVLALADPDGRLQRHVLAPMPSLPQLPTVESPQIARELEYLQISHSSENPFLSIEEDWQYLIENSKSKTFKSIEIHLTGELASLKIVNPEHLNSNFFPISKSEVAIYHVKVERRSGKVFWFLAEQTPQAAALQEKAETILRSIIFEPDMLAFVSDGDIEITFNGPEGAL